MLVIPCLTLLAAILLTGWVFVGNRRRRRLDWLFLGATAPFALLSLLDLLGRAGYLSGALLVSTRLAYQAMILGVAAFVLTLLRATQPFYRSLYALLAVCGVVLAIWPIGELPTLRFPTWQLLNITLVTIFVVSLTLKLWRRGGTRAWFVLVAVVMALSVMVTDLLGHIARPIVASWPQLFFMPVLCLLWLVATGRVKFFVRSAGSRRSAGRPRRDLAQDLHDGVGGHLASIISTLDPGTATERALAIRLRECLVELKLLVDGADDDLSLPELLASFRYRMQPLLKSMGLTLVWNLVPDASLEAIRGTRARHILRIVQEAFANVVQHSKADTLSFTCDYRARGHALVLEVTDNGVGWRRTGADVEGGPHARGKGIHGMEERARHLGGQLSIGPASNHTGTRVLLTMPFDASESPGK